MFILESEFSPDSTFAMALIFCKPGFRLDIFFTFSATLFAVFPVKFLGMAASKVSRAWTRGVPCPCKEVSPVKRQWKWAEIYAEFSLSRGNVIVSFAFRTQVASSGRDYSTFLMTT